MAPVRGGMVRLTSSRDNEQLTLILNGPPDRSGGVGGWEASERALRAPAKWYKNTPDDTISLDCLLDIDAIGGPSVERRLRVLRNMGQPLEDDDPPTITLDGDVWSEDKQLTWIIQGVTQGDRLWNPDGTLRRQQVTISLERFNPLSEIKAMRIKGTRDSKRRRRRRVAIAKGNDTLRGIALRELGDASRWKDLVRWNKKLKKVDPDARLRSGTHIAIK